MKVKNLGNEVTVIVTDETWANTLADFGTEKAEGATINEGLGFYRNLASNVLKEEVWVVTVFVKNVMQFQVELVDLLREYLEDTKEESVLIHTGGKAKLYYLD